MCAAEAAILIHSFISRRRPSSKISRLPSSPGRCQQKLATGSAAVLEGILGSLSRELYQAAFAPRPFAPTPCGDDSAGGVPPRAALCQLQRSRPSQPDDNRGREPFSLAHTHTYIHTHSLVQLHTYARTRSLKVGLHELFSPINP